MRLLGPFCPPRLDIFFNRKVFLFNIFIEKTEPLLVQNSETFIRVSVSSVRERFVRLWRCRLLSVPSGEQVSRRRLDCSDFYLVTRSCSGAKTVELSADHGILEMVTPAMRRSSVLLLFFFKLANML